MNHIATIEGFEVAIASLVEKVTICELYAGIYIRVPFPSQSKVNDILDSALPELYATVIVFTVKARTYFQDRGTHATWNINVIKSC